MAFYQFRQNNSGGSFDYDDRSGLSVNVYIEAGTADEANSRAEDLGIYFDGVDNGSDCSCCGDRWYRVGEYDRVDSVLQEDEDFSAGAWQIKWTKDGEYETFEIGRAHV